MDVNFGVGDLVQLREGGPVMKVVELGHKSLEGDEMDAVLCTWTDKQLHYEWVFERPKLNFVGKERRLLPRLMRLPVSMQRAS